MRLKQLILLALCTFLFSFSGLSQSVTIGNGVFAGNYIYGPCNTFNNDSAYSKHIYLYPSSLFSSNTGSLQHGDTISSLEFRRDGSTGLTGKVQMRILLKLTDSTDLGTTNLNWLFESIDPGVVEVYKGDPTATIGNAAGFVPFVFNVGNKGFTYDTTKGKNLQVFIEYQAMDSIPGRINWFSDNRATVTGYAINQTKYINGFSGTPLNSTNRSSDMHPQMKINFPRYSRDLSLVKSYSLGKLPVPIGNPDSVIALVENKGKYQIDSIYLFVESKGANPEIDSILLRNIGINETRYIKLPALTPSNYGIDTLMVYVKKDDNSANNNQLTYRRENKNLYSYKDPFTPPTPGGIGFNGGTGDFVARFHSNSQKAVNQVSVNFGTLNRPFQMGLWDATGTNGTPGNLLYLSDTLTSTSPLTVLPVIPFVKVNGDFFVGIRQTGTVNVAFGYQLEDPVRRQTFFYAAPAGSTTWIDFAPGAPFRFMIEPRLQEPNDVAPIAVINPVDTVSVIGPKTIAPEATIINYGSLDQITGFDVTFEVFNGGNTLYTNTKSVALNSGITKNVKFDSTLVLTQPGTYQTRVITRLQKDSVPSNDTLYGSFIVPKYLEIVTLSIDTPSGVIDYRLRDTMAPKATVKHRGLRNAPMGFKATFEIYAFSGSQLVFTSSVRDTLKPLESKQLVFDSTYFPVQLYDYITRVIIVPDTLSHNDTLESSFSVEKGLDVLPAFTYDPTQDGVYELNVDVIYSSVFVQNPSSTNANNFDCKYELFDSSGKLYWRDSTTLSIKAGESKIVDMPIIYCDVEGVFQLRAYTNLLGDQYPENDTLIVNFKVQKSNDIGVVTSLIPKPGEVVEPSNKAIIPTVLVNNYGLEGQGAFNTILRIYKDNTLVYEQTEASLVGKGDDVTIKFPGFIPNIKGFYQIEAFTTLYNDQLHNNDTFRGEFTIGAPYDIQPMSFLMPQPDSVYQQNDITLKPEVRFYNDGFLNADTLFNVYFEAYSEGTRFYRDVESLTLGIGETKTIAFDSNFVPSTAGEIEIRAFSTLYKDYKPLNDTLRAKIYTVRDNDVSADSIYVPGTPDSVLVNIESFLPQFVVKNLGIKNLDDNWDISCVIKDPNGAIVYDEMSTVSDVDSGIRKVALFSKLFTTKMEGWYSITFISLNPMDQEPSNDTLRHQFYSVVKYDADATQMLYPTDGQTVNTDLDLKLFPSIKIKQHPLFALTDTFPVVLEIFSDGSIVYTDTVKTSLGSNETKSITFNKGFSRIHKGGYTVVAFTDYAKEQNQENDSLTGTFSLDFPTSISNLDVKPIVVYPNPVRKNGVVRITSIKQLKDSKLFIYNSTGQLIDEMVLEENQFKLPANLSEGTYILMLNSDTQVHRAILQVVE